MIIKGCCSERTMSKTRCSGAKVVRIALADCAED